MGRAARASSQGCEPLGDIRGWFLRTSGDVLGNLF